MDTRPYYRRSKPKQHDRQEADTFLHLVNTFRHLPKYPAPDPSGVFPDSRPLANSLFDGRAAAAVHASVVDPWAPFYPTKPEDSPFLTLNNYVKGPNLLHLTYMCLAAMAYDDYFPENGDSLRSNVSQAIMKAEPGYCGSFGPGVTGAPSLKDGPGDYDLTQMWLLPLAYSYYNELQKEAAERLITVLLAEGIIHRPNEDDIYTCGGAPKDWSRAGYVSPAGFHVTIPETENHVLMIATTRYLTNQLIYPRNPSIKFDNRRNIAGCTEQLLNLLRNQLKNDFAEYNAKPYQEETRHALLNLCSYAYDAEVRLGARMVLDYISAHIAVSSNDLRRMVPFRRRSEKDKEKDYIKQIPEEPGFMDVSLLDGDTDPTKVSADQITVQFALLAGNTRAYPNYPNWVIPQSLGHEMTFGAVSDYRLPPSIHDLFVNDLNRRFFQRLHRHLMLNEPGQQRNADNMEIYAGSPSYLITAGGRPARWVIPGDYGEGYDNQNIGVAVPTSFMPTGLSAGVKIEAAHDLIQILHFSNKFEDDISDGSHGGTENYGVAPDFACGFASHFPNWTGVPKDKDGVFFVNSADLKPKVEGELAGFFLAIIKWQGFVILEAFDTWLHPDVRFEQFTNHMMADNSSIMFKAGGMSTRPLSLKAAAQVLGISVPFSFRQLTAAAGSGNIPHAFNSGQETIYTTFNGNRIHFVIWNKRELDNHEVGSIITKIEYGAGNPTDTLKDAGNYYPHRDPYQFLTGTILKTVDDSGDGVVMEIHNPLLGTKITLDWHDLWHPKRISESGEVEEAGNNHEVWVDSEWTGPFEEGDFFRPFKTLAAAVNAVADGGVIKILPGTRSERLSIRKRVRLVAALGDVKIGGR